VRWRALEPGLLSADVRSAVALCRWSLLQPERRSIVAEGVRSLLQAGCLTCDRVVLESLLQPERRSMVAEGVRSLLEAGCLTCDRVVLELLAQADRCSG
jgi:hypothetical protein